LNFQTSLPRLPIGMLRPNNQILVVPLVLGMPIRPGIAIFLRDD
jgi:hypothetical protein